MSTVDEYITNYYTFVGPRDEEVQSIVNTVEQACKLAEGSWKALPGHNIQEVLQEASAKTEDNYILHKWYQGVGSPVHAKIYYNGQVFDAYELIDEKPDLEDIKHTLKQQKLNELQQQKQKIQGKLNEIESKIEQWVEDEEES